MHTSRTITLLLVTRGGNEPSAVNVEFRITESQTSRPISEYRTT